jgi:hypothetical protein
VSQFYTTLGEILTDALDKDTFAIATSRPPPEFTRTCFLLNQGIEEMFCMDWLEVLSSPVSSKAVAVVDRTANLTEAAKAIAEASALFGGKSKYAPQVVLVNEFIADDFMSTLLPELDISLRDDVKMTRQHQVSSLNDEKVAQNTAALAHSVFKEVMEWYVD